MMEKRMCMKAEGKRKDEKISIRCTREEKQMIMVNAGKLYMKAGDYMIMCVQCKSKTSYAKILKGPVYTGICNLLTEVNKLSNTKENENIKEEAERLCAYLNM